MSLENERKTRVRTCLLRLRKSRVIQRRATSLLGNVDAISDYPKLGRLSVLLGRPQNEEYQKHYIRAKNILHKMPVKHELVEEDEVEDFAKELGAYMRSHGLIDE